MGMNTATYSPEDDKLRLYVGRVPRAEYEALRAAGWVSTPKQDCDFVAVWTPRREDMALEYLDEGEDIGDEDYSTTERAADRAERFTGYRDKRAEEAGASADTFNAGPRAFGHQSQARAERQAARHDRHRSVACSQWSKAEYWQARTVGVIANALHRSSAAVRRGRILTLEAEQRKHEASREDYAKRYALWQKVLTLEGIDTPIQQTQGHNEQRDGITILHLPKLVAPTPGGKLAYDLANSSCGEDWTYTHPRNSERKATLHCLLTDSADPITPREAATLWLNGKRDPNDSECYSARWSAHYALRLAYERAMIAEEGGTAAEADMVPGGWIRGGSVSCCLSDCESGWKQIQAVNKSPVTGRVVSVKVWGTYTANGTAPKSRLVNINVERMPEGAYRAPTAEELAAFKAATKERKAKEKATKPKAPPLINPTDEDAERLQALWNEHARAGWSKETHYKDCPQSAVLRMTQAEYSAASKGTYAKCDTADVSEQGRRRSQSAMGRDRAGRVTVFQVRRTSGGGLYTPDRVIILTDKPQKPIPWGELDAQRAAQPSVESMTPRLAELAKVLGQSWLPEGEQRRLINDAAYIGWAYVSSMTQFGWTPKGLEAYKANCQVDAAQLCEVNA